MKHNDLSIEDSTLFECPYWFDPCWDSVWEEYKRMHPNRRTEDLSTGTFREVDAKDYYIQLQKQEPGIQ